jgi:mannose-1-phosphate guanylyltransferase
LRGAGQLNVVFPGCAASTNFPNGENLISSWSDQVISHYKRSSCWCIVVADDQRVDWVSDNCSRRRYAPVQYSRLGGNESLLQKALRRASRIAPTAQIIITALEEFRQLWEPLTWAIPPENKFVGDNRATALLTSAAALLSIVAKNPANIVIILPARCHVASESTLQAALTRAVALVPHVEEGVATLGMMDWGVGVDEDYWLTSRAKRGPGCEIRGFARRPIPWIARHLRARGAMVASGIAVGYAGTFAAHITKQWPGISRQLMNIVDDAAVAGTECEVPVDMQRGVPSPVLQSLGWRFPTFTQRAFQVNHCGWSSLKSAQAIERINPHSSTTPSMREEMVSQPQSGLWANQDRGRLQNG